VSARELARLALEEHLSALAAADHEDAARRSCDAIVAAHAALVAEEPGARDVWDACQCAIDEHAAAQSAALHAGDTRAKWSAGARRGRVEGALFAIAKWERDQADALAWEAKREAKRAEREREQAARARAEAEERAGRNSGHGTILERDFAGDVPLGVVFPPDSKER
jgi:hypothetical protein